MPAPTQRPNWDRTPRSCCGTTGRRCGPCQLDRQLAALFSSDLRAGIMSLLETMLRDSGFNDPRTAVIGSTNIWGDHVGHTVDLGRGNQSALAIEEPFHPSARQIGSGYGAAVVSDFLGWAAVHGVRVIGGLPTGFADSPISDDSVAAIRTVYREQGAGFLELANRSRYPRADFFDTPDHLNEAAQIRHSMAVGQGLLQMSGRLTAAARVPSVSPIAAVQPAAARASRAPDPSP